MAEEEQERASRQAAALLVVGPQGTLTAPATEAAQPSTAKKPNRQRPKRRLTHSASTVGLNFAAKREADESEFMARIEGAFAQVAASRKLAVRVEDEEQDRSRLSQ